MNNTRKRTNKLKQSRKKIHTQMYNMDGVRHALYEQSKSGMNFNNLSKLVTVKQKMQYNTRWYNIRMLKKIGINL